MAKYDLAVLGAGLGGLAVAALMSSNGKKVIVLESGDSLDAALGVREFEGFRFFRDAPLSYGFEEGGIFTGLFARLGLVHDGLTSPSRYQVALPDRRITVSANQEETYEELKREFPRERETIAHFFRDLKKEAAHISKSRLAAYFARRTSAAKFIRKYHFSAEFTIFLDIQSRFFYQRPIDQLPDVKLITLCTTPPTRFAGGIQKLADQFLALLRKNGGEIRFGETPPEIVTRSGRVIGIRTGQNVVEARTVLLDVPDTQVPMYYLGIHDHVVPVSMEQDVLYLPDYARPEAFLSISLSAKDDVASAPVKSRALTVSLRSAGNFAGDQRALIAPLADIMPFLNDNMFFVKPSQPAAPSFILPNDVTFKPIRSSAGLSLLAKASRKNLYMLHDAQYQPLEVMTAVQKFVADTA